MIKKAMRLTRRKFMGMMAGGLIGGSIVAPPAFGKVKTANGESVEKKCCDIIYDGFGKGIECPNEAKVNLPKEIVKPWNEPTDEEREGYDVIDDLVEEMNRHDKLFLNREIQYAIHTNYSGLGILKATGHLEKEEYEPSLNRGYKHVLWIPVNLPGVSRGVCVGTSAFMKADISLMAYLEEKNKAQKIALRHYWLVTTRCFDVDCTESGKALMSLC